MQRPRAEITIRGPLLPVLAHEPSLAQAISNLLGNAVKFVPAGEPPRIVVRTEARGPKVRLWVEDNGIGIKPEHQARIFGIFERLPTVGRYEGTGIGLAIVRKAAEKMGGSSGVESDGLTGSRFWIELPAAQNT
jgi:signal transduction histidine kinase